MTPIWEREPQGPDFKRSPEVYCGQMFDIITVEAEDEGVPTVRMLRHEWRMEVINELVMNAQSQIVGVQPIKPPMENVPRPLFYCIHCRYPLISFRAPVQENAANEGGGPPSNGLVRP